MDVVVLLDRGHPHTLLALPRRCRSTNTPLLNAVHDTRPASKLPTVTEITERFQSLHVVESQAPCNSGLHQQTPRPPPRCRLGDDSTVAGPHRRDRYPAAWNPALQQSYRAASMDAVGRARTACGIGSQLCRGALLFA